MSQHRHGPVGGIVAVDIECVNLIPEPDLEFSDPSHWSVFCIPVGYRSPTGDVTTAVIFRRGPSLNDERELIERVTDWIRDSRPSKIITYNGEHYDYPILRHRAGVTATESLGAHDTLTNLEIVIGNIEHTDLFPVVKEDAGYNVPLDSALNYHDIPTEETELNGSVIDGSDMPDLGVRIMTGDATAAEKKAVADYAESDVEPLFSLYSAVCE